MTDGDMEWNCRKCGKRNRFNQSIKNYGLCEHELAKLLIGEANGKETR